MPRQQQQAQRPSAMERLAAAKLSAARTPAWYRILQEEQYQGQQQQANKTSVRRTKAWPALPLTPVSAKEARLYLSPTSSERSSPVAQQEISAHQFTPPPDIARTAADSETDVSQRPHRPSCLHSLLSALSSCLPRDASMERTVPLTIDGFAGEGTQQLQPQPQPQPQKGLPSPQRLPPPTLLLPPSRPATPPTLALPQMPQPQSPFS